MYFEAAQKQERIAIGRYESVRD